jgi:hypothetical protein
MEAIMELAEFERVRDRFVHLVHERFPDAPISRIEVLQYGDDPEVEPGQLIARLVIDTPADAHERVRAFEAFHSQFGEAFNELRRELDKLAAPVLLQIVAGGEPSGLGGLGAPRIQQLAARSVPCGPESDAPELTPVMARLSREDVATLDTLITAGIASSRAEAVRWTLARIRERPAFEQLRAHTREIETLKSQF